MAESEDKLKSLLMRVKEESEKVGLKPNIKKTKIMVSSPITSWHIEGEKVEAVTVFLFLGSKITKDSDLSHEIKRDLQSSDVQMWELGCRESWAPKKWSFQTVVMEKTLESPLDRKSIKAVSLKGNQPWIFIGRTDVEAEAPILWPSDVRIWLIGKDSVAGKDRGQEEKGRTEDEMFGWYHQLDGHEFEQTPRDSEGQESLACFCEWVTESDMT